MYTCLRVLVPHFTYVQCSGGDDPKWMDVCTSYVMVLAEGLLCNECGCLRGFYIFMSVNMLSSIHLYTVNVHVHNLEELWNGIRMCYKLEAHSGVNYTCVMPVCT